MKVGIAIGTRAELIKLAPLVHTLRSAGAETNIFFSGQHTVAFLKPWMDFFHIQPDLELNIPQSHHNPMAAHASLLAALSARKFDLACDLMVVQGGSPTAFSAAQFAFLEGIPLAHVEAGLRTHNLRAPFPEEGFRQQISRLAQFHFAPTFQAARNLMREGIAREELSVVGNTGIDSLLFAMKNLELIEATLLNRIPAYLRDFIESENMVLVTIHRYENLGERFTQICTNLLRLSREVPNIRLLFPLYPDDAIQERAQELLGDAPNILLCDPMPYLPFIYMMSKSKLVITDSAGVMEEAPTLRLPVLVVRENCDRPEAFDAGFAQLVGFDSEKLLRETHLALRNGCQGLGVNPFGDGTAAKRIVKKLTGADNLEQNIIISMIENELVSAEADATHLEDIHSEESPGSGTDGDPTPYSIGSDNFNNVIQLPITTK